MKFEDDSFAIVIFIAIVSVVIIGIGCWFSNDLVLDLNCPDLNFTSNGHIDNYSGWQELNITGLSEYIDLPVILMEPSQYTTPQYYVHKIEERRYYCSDTAKIYWKYPSLDDKAFNAAWEYCNSTFPDMFEPILNVNSSDWVDWGENLIYLKKNSYPGLDNKIEKYSLNSFRGNITLVNTTCKTINCPGPCEEGICYPVQCLECK